MFSFNTRQRAHAALVVLNKQTKRQRQIVILPWTLIAFPKNDSYMALF